MPARNYDFETRIRFQNQKTLIFIKAIEHNFFNESKSAYFHVYFISKKEISNEVFAQSLFFVDIIQREFSSIFQFTSLFAFDIVQHHNVNNFDYLLEFFLHDPSACFLISD